MSVIDRIDNLKTLADAERAGDPLHGLGVQRTVPMWEELLGGVGLCIVKIRSGQMGMESVIEVEKL
ncbi:hypothetical protein LTR08_008485 [Meristemomyces frigidus]|nr:hypothetical protein LTR08_008485 [Meristemomyces frigidus]